MKKIFLLLLVFTFPCFVTAQDISKILRERLQGEPFGSGISVAVVDEAGTKFYNFGKVSKQADAKFVNENTVYEIGSVTKVFTGTLLAEAVKRGEVKLDDPISKYLPETVKTPKFGGREITLLDLTTHSSALPRLPANLKPKNPLNPYADYTAGQMYEFLGEVKLDGEIGSKIDYSNLGVGLLGHILALRANMSYEDLVKQRILEPLGMNDTAVTFSPAMKSRLAVGYDSEGKQISNWDFQALAGAGALRSTAADMAKFLSANLGFSKTKLTDSLTEAQKVRRSADDSPLKVGFNWITTKPGEKEIIWHNGGTGGYRSFAGIEKESKKGVFVVTNGFDSVDDIGFHILDSKVPLREAEESKPVKILDEKILETYVGEYQLAPTFSVIITREGKQLFGQATNQPRFELFAESEDEFFIKAVKASVTFTKDENGKIDGLVLHQGGSDIPGKKIK